MIQTMQTWLRATARLSLTAALIFGPVRLFAQDYPNFSTGGDLPSIEMDGAPATAGDTDTLYTAYSDGANNGFLSVLTLTGTTRTRYTSTIQMNSDPAVAVAPNTTTLGTTNPLYIAFVGEHLSIYVYSWSPAAGFNPVCDFAAPSLAYAVQPALALVPDPNLPKTVAGGNDIYLAWQGQAYDPDTGNDGGQWIDVAYSINGGQSFVPDDYNSVDQVSVTYPATSGPAMAYFNGLLYLSYLTTNGNAQMFTLSTPETIAFTNTSGSGGVGGQYAGNPTLGSLQDSLFEGFRSYYSEDNLWVVGIFDNGEAFGPSYRYSQTLSYSPAFAYVGPASGVGTLYYRGRSNSSTDLTSFYATENSINP